MKSYEIPAYQLVMLESVDVITASSETKDDDWDAEWM